MIKVKLINNDNGLIPEDLLKQIALAGFDTLDDDFKKSIENAGYMYHNGVYRLYNENEGYFFSIPKETFISITYYPENRFIQFNGYLMYRFNHYAAIKKMEELNLLNF